MKHHTAYHTFKTSKKMELINITSMVKDEVAKSGIKEGLVLVSPKHITSSIFINDEESGLKEDFLKWLEGLAPYEPESYRHNLTMEDNAHAHLKRTVMGRETVVAVTAGKMDFGPWEEIFYGEFDGQRPKKILIKVIGE